VSQNSVDAKEAAADLLVDVAPLGLRSAISERTLDRQVLTLVDRAVCLPTRLDGTQRHRHLLQQLVALLTTVPAHQAPEGLTFSEVAAAHPDAALLVVGAPTRDGNLGARTGQQLSLATIGLLANASAVIAALFALPADEHCTSVVAAACIQEIRAGTAPAEALRRARAAFWHSRPSQLRGQAARTR
jgi:hypothetical protein